jgi:hypothetical protein
VPFVVIAWPAFGLFDSRPALGRCVLDNERLLVFER